jgi:putative PIN family toxin of toxin-antitoxin system
MNRIVLDINVLMSGIFWSGAPYKILKIWQERSLQLVFSQEILDEYSRVGDILSKKYHRINLNNFIELLTVYGEFSFPVRLKRNISRDPDDDKFIACALGARCPVIVSGDKDLLEISGYADIQIKKPADFIKSLNLPINNIP